MARTLNPPSSDTESGDLRKQRQLIAALLDPRRYPHPAKTVRLIETHISWILLAGRYAYKIKKSVDLGFIDTTRLETRHEHCCNELRLNRRLAPQIYLAVLPIGGSHSRPELGAQPAIEYAVKMRRFAPRNTLDNLVTRKKLSPDQMDILANSLAKFHASLPAAENSTPSIFAMQVHSTLEQNLSQLYGQLSEAADTNMLGTLRQASAQNYAALRQHIQERQPQGYVRECHGDLHLGNIALVGNQPTPFDGIDFNASLRWIDVIDEVAFLFMDLLHHRRTDLAYRFLNTYLELTGDYSGVGLLNFYAAYRAMVRAKVCAIRANQDGIAPRHRSKTMNICRDYLNLAVECSAQRQAKLLIMHGLPGSGKSTFAQAALEHIGAIRLRSDVERKRLFGLGALADSSTGKNIYSTDATQRTYAHLLDTTRTLLSAGHTVIVDAAFLRSAEREMFFKLAEELHKPFAIVSMRADDAALRERIIKRQTLANDASEADLAVLAKLRTVQQELSQRELPYTLVLQDIAISVDIWDKLDNLLHSSG
jgi:aminoglycoside phosphotransferase family enzyme/predicted kinase